MLEELKKAQANFIIKNKKYQEDLTALEVGELDEQDDETLGRVYKYLKKEYEELVEKRNAISYIREKLEEMEKPVPNNLEGKPLREILALQTKVMNDHDAYSIMVEYRNRTNSVSAVGQKVKKSKKKSKRLKKKSKGKNKRKPSKKK